MKTIHHHFGPNLLTQIKSLIASTIFLAAVLPTFAQPIDIIASQKEAKHLTSTSSPSREYLSCAALSTHLNMNDVYSLFIRKAAELTTDPIALAFAINYIFGFTDSEIMQIQGDTKSPNDASEVIKKIYSLKCIKHIMPK